MANCSCCIIEVFNDSDPYRYITNKIRKHYKDNELILGLVKRIVINNKETIDLIWNYCIKLNKENIVYNLLTSGNNIKVELAINLIKCINKIK